MAELSPYFVNPSQVSHDEAKDSFTQLGLPPEFADLAPIEPPTLDSSGPNAGDDDTSTAQSTPTIRIHRPTTAFSFLAKQTAVHELAHAMEDGMSQDQWDQFLKLRQQYPSTERQATTEDSRYHKLTPYFDDYHELGTPIPPAIVDFLKQVGPSLIKIASERQQWH